MSALLHRFESLIAARCGLRIPERGRGDLQDALLARMRALRMATAAQYYALLKGEDDESELEWQQLAPLLTNRVNYFFRDTGQLHLLKDRILPESIARHTRDRILRIWSAGCSTGEETYSLAILAHRLLPQGEGWTVSVLGTDVDAEALDRARAGVYSPLAFSVVTPPLWQGFFEQTENGCEVSAEIKAMVRFQQGDLVRDEQKRPGCFPGLPVRSLPVGI